MLMIVVAVWKGTLLVVVAVVVVVVVDRNTTMQAAVVVVHRCVISSDVPIVQYSESYGT